MKHQHLAVLYASLLYLLRNGEVLDQTPHVCCERICVYLCENEVINQNFFALFPQTLLFLISSAPFPHVDSCLSKKRKEKKKKEISSRETSFHIWQNPTWRL